MAGKGEAVWGHGIEYKGGFQGNKRHGQGRCVWWDGTTYEGMWADGKANGYGVLTMPDNFKYVGKFKNNLFIEPFTLRQKRQSSKSNFPIKALTGDHGRAWLLDKRA